jgi:hypothetical protein
MREDTRPSGQRRLAVAAAAAAGLLVAAWLLRIDGPRRLPFPTLEPRAPFPELTPQGGATPEPSAEPAKTSRFEAALRHGGSAEPATSGAGTGAVVPASALTLALGGGLVGDLLQGSGAADGDWRWASQGWATLAVHVPAAGRPDALVFAEPFSPLWLERPSAELLRFHLTLLPASVLGRPLATATGGWGLGFEPGEDGATGTRWAGRNEHGTTLRLERFDGAWGGQRPLAAGPVDDLARVPAYLVTGSVTTDDESFGAHLALLCSRAPECPVAEELAALLASVRLGEPGRVARLLEGTGDSLGDLAARAGLSIEEPRPEPSARP